MDLLHALEVNISMFRNFTSLALWKQLLIDLLAPPILVGLIWFRRNGDAWLWGNKDYKMLPRERMITLGSLYILMFGITIYGCIQ
ncbi:MAG: hypothetical protein V4555_16320 [Acidobacteriota bacterium]